MSDSDDEDDEDVLRSAGGDMEDRDAAGEAITPPREDAVAVAGGLGPSLSSLSRLHHHRHSLPFIIPHVTVAALELSRSRGWRLRRAAQLDAMYVVFNCVVNDETDDMRRSTA